MLNCSQVVDRRVVPHLAEITNDSLQAHAMLVARGGHPMSLVGSCSTGAQDTLTDMALVLEQNCSPGCIPFLVDRRDGQTDFGYAAAPWVLELYRWAVGRESAPPRQRNRIMGLLLGFGVDAINQFEATWTAAGTPEEPATF